MSNDLLRDLRATVSAVERMLHDADRDRRRAEDAEAALREMREVVSAMADRADRDLTLMGETRTPGTRNTRAFAEGVARELRDLASAGRTEPDSVERRAEA